MLDGRLVISGLNDQHGPAAIDGVVRRVGFDGNKLDETPVSATIPADRSTEIASLAVPDDGDFFYLLEAREAGAGAYDDTLRMVFFPKKYKHYDLPEATVRLDAWNRPGVFTVTADKPAFFIKPEASEFAGAFDDASFTLLPGERRTIAFRSFDGRMPAVGDISVRHLGTTYR
jgi:beta-mannosidase